MRDNIVCIATFNPKFNEYLTKKLDVMAICQSIGLIKHIEKRHPECMVYVPLLPEIIASPDYIGVNPNEQNPSFELVKIIDKNIQVGIKLDSAGDYLYVATLHTITDSKLQHGIQNGRLKKIDK